MGEAGPPGADIQLEHGYLRLANRLTTAIALAPWDSAPQPRMVMALIRATYGMMGRKTAELGTADWRALTGMDDRKIRRTKLQLQEEGVLILVRDFDARGQRPQVWQLEKDFTRWGKYSLSAEEVKAAEDHLTKQGTPKGPGDTDTRGDQGTQTPGEQGTPVTGGQGSPMTPGAGSEAAPVLDERHPKERKERKDIDRRIDRATPADRDALISRVIITANRGMQKNPSIDQHRFRPIPTTGAGRQAVSDWLDDGIPLETILAAVYEVASERFKADGANDQIGSMSYFTKPVQRAWDVQKADESEDPAGAALSKADRKLIRRRQELESVDLSGSRSVFNGD